MSDSAAMSKQSDGIPNSSRLSNGILIMKAVKMCTFVGDCQVDCIMKLFQPLTISYTDFTDWIGT